MTSNFPCCNYWQALLIANRQRLTPWKDLITEILQKVEPAVELHELRNEEEVISRQVLERVSDVFDETFTQFDKMDYYLKLSLKSEIYKDVVGLFVRQLYMSDGYTEQERGALESVLLAILIKSVKEPPMTVENWRQLSCLLTESVVQLYAELIDRVELQIMYITGNTVYTYFEERCSKAEVDSLLENAFETLSLEEEVRQFTSRHGNGHTKTILQFVERWQEDRQMKEVDRIKPFLVCLEAYWHGKIRLGSRQGVEKMYNRLRY